MIAATERQAGFALDTASVILFVVDGLDGITALDERIAARLRRGSDHVILVVNKADFDDEKADIAGAARLGFGAPLSFRPSTGAARRS